MKFDQLEDKMRRFECYHEQRILQDSWFIVRLDGRSFSKLTKRNFIKPFDDKLSAVMQSITSGLVAEYQAEYGYTESDEISLLFRPSWSMYERRVEKIVSLMAASATSTFVNATHISAQFDSRAIVIPTKNSLVDYFRWRQGDAVRNALSQFAFWTLVGGGMTENKASAELQRCGFKDKLNKLFELKVDFFTVPTKFRYGIGFYWEYYTKDGFDPRTGETKKTSRRRVSAIDPLPIGDAYSQYITSLIEAAEAPAIKIETKPDETPKL